MLASLQSEHTEAVSLVQPVLHTGPGQYVVSGCHCWHNAQPTCWILSTAGTAHHCQEKHNSSSSCSGSCMHHFVSCCVAPLAPGSQLAPRNCNFLAVLHQAMLSKPLGFWPKS